MARPQKTAALTEEQIVQLAAFGCTDEEIAVLAELDEATVKRSFAPLLKKGRADMRARLRSAQVKKALGHFVEKADKDGNAEIYLTPPDNTMLIWLGKQYLDQRDKQEIAGDAERPLVFDHRTAVTALARRSGGNSVTPSADEGGSDGT